MAEVHKPSIGILQRRRPASAAHESLAHSAAALGGSAVRLSSAVLTWPAVAIGRLLLGSRRTRIGGYHRTGYPEMDHWMAGRRHRSDK